MATDLTRKFIYEYLRGLDAPRALTVWILYSQGEHDQLTKLEWKPEWYNSFEEVRDSLAATKFLSKSTFLSLSHDKKAVALEKFFECESHCKETNKRLRALGRQIPETTCALSRMSEKISQVLGSFTADELIDACDFGPGATVSMKRSQASKPTKYLVERGTSSGTYDLIKDWFHLAYPLWKIDEFEIQNFNRVVTVPKNSKTDRTIAIEPGLNLWFQKGIGTLIRRRLKHFGIDLNNQKHNQSLSRLGSKFGHLVTVDFSSASDLISRKLVEELLPGNWLLWLVALRSSCGVFEGKKISYEKFSSMGNGFTFELETLIFWSLAVHCCEQTGSDLSNVSVYGDDVIIPSNAYDMFQRIATDLGFIVNTQKSYSTGYFRESCGAFWYNGRNVKPIYLKDDITALESKLKMANAVIKHASCGSQIHLDKRFYACYQVIKKTIDTRVPIIPDGFGDLGLIGNLDDAKGVKPARNGVEGFLVPMRVRSPVLKEIEHRGLLIQRIRELGCSNDTKFNPLRIVELSSIGNFEPVHNHSKYRVKPVLVPRWIGVGSWV